MGPVRIDLHTHSTASDGTEAPARGGRGRGGRRARRRRADRPRHDGGLGRGHRLGATRTASRSCAAPRSPPARTASASTCCPTCRTRRTRRSRSSSTARATRALNRARAIVELLAADCPITWDDVLAQSRDAVVVGRPHIADALVARGVVPDRDAAFAHLLRADGPYHVPHYAPDGRRRRARDPGRRRRARLRAPGRRRPRPGRARRASSTRSPRAGLAGLEVRPPRPLARRSARGSPRSRSGSGCSSRARATTTGRARPTGWGRTSPTPEVLAAIEDQGTTKVVRP